MIEIGIPSNAIDEVTEYHTDFRNQTNIATASWVSTPTMPSSGVTTPEECGCAAKRDIFSLLDLALAQGYVK